VSAVSIAYDLDKEGAGPTRNRAKNVFTTDYIAFLDDDDEMLPNHIETLLGHIEYHNADVAYSWFKVVGGSDPFPDNRWKEFDPEHPHAFGITALVRTSVAQSVDFVGPSTEWYAGGEDWTWWLTLAEQGAKFVGTADITWIYHHDSFNTSGRPERWK
jgi:glycosyltransferase involved in cell wall biosynthesis